MERGGGGEGAGGPRASCFCSSFLAQVRKAGNRGGEEEEEEGSISKYGGKILCWLHLVWIIFFVGSFILFLQTATSTRCCSGIFFGCPTTARKAWDILPSIPGGRCGRAGIYVYGEQPIISMHHAEKSGNSTGSGGWGRGVGSISYTQRSYS